MATVISKTEQALLAKIAELEAKLTKKQTLSLKVSEKGGISVYGLMRFPVTLYKGQWERLIAIVPELRKFIADNAGSLSEKE